MLRAALAVLATTTTTIAAADTTPVVSSDGARIVVPYVAEDGARGSPNLTYLVADRTGAIVQRIAVVDLDRGDIPGGAAAAAHLLAALRPTVLPEVAPKNPNDPDTLRLFPGLAVQLSPDGTLTVRPDGQGPLLRQDASWRTEPDRVQRAEMDRRLAAGQDACFNPAGISTVYFDARRRVAVVYVHFHGNDTCWEPSSDVAVFAW